LPWPAYLQSLLGGALIGLAASALLILNGRVAGISGIAGGLVDNVLGGGADGISSERAAFLVGLLVGPLVFMAFSGAPDVGITRSLPLLVVGGLLVGYGTRLSSGCTAGHGVCGLARLSRRSIAAVATFFAVAIVTVFVMEHAI
jgi:uncharacterized membrane protein YedE/YeeE